MDFNSDDFDLEELVFEIAESVENVTQMAYTSLGINVNSHVDVRAGELVIYGELPHVLMAIGISVLKGDVVVTKYEIYDDGKAFARLRSLKEEGYEG